MKESNNLELWVSMYYKQHKSINLHLTRRKENWESDKILNIYLWMLLFNLSNTLKPACLV